MSTSQPPRHRGAHTRARSEADASGGRSWRPRLLLGLSALLAVAVVVAGTVFGLQALAGRSAPSSAEFTGVVTRFADDGALMCVRRQASSEAPFCDVYYVPPDTVAIEVGDRVLVRTITSSTDDGAVVSGMLVTPVPD